MTSSSAKGEVEPPSEEAGPRRAESSLFRRPRFRGLLLLGGPEDDPELELIVFVERYKA